MRSAVESLAQMSGFVTATSLLMHLRTCAVNARTTSPPLARVQFDTADAATAAMAGWATVGEGRMVWA